MAEEKQEFIEFDAPKELKMMIFPPVINPDALKMTRESVYSTSPPDQAKLVIDIASAFFDLKETTITDATANIGGNLYAMIPVFKKVNAVEINPQTFGMLKHNVSIIHPTAGNVTFVNTDYSQIYRDLMQDVMFIDPPWGGVDYHSKKDQELYLSEMPLRKLIADMPHNAGLVIAKLPTTYPVADLVDENRWMFSKLINVTRKGKGKRRGKKGSKGQPQVKVVYNLLVLSNVLPMRTLKSSHVTKHLNYRQFL
jgi:predicted RNA methylase